MNEHFYMEIYLADTPHRRNAQHFGGGSEQLRICKQKNVQKTDVSVREYWIVNPAKEIVNAYNFEAEEDCNLYSFDDPIPSGIYPGFFVCIRELL